MNHYTKYFAIGLALLNCSTSWVVHAEYRLSLVPSLTRSDVFIDNTVSRSGSNSMRSERWAPIDLTHASAEGWKEPGTKAVLEFYSRCKPAGATINVFIKAGKTPGQTYSTDQVKDHEQTFLKESQRTSREEWTKHSYSIEIPRDAHMIRVRIISKNGEIFWLDDVTFSIGTAPDNLVNVLKNSDIEQDPLDDPSWLKAMLNNGLNYADSKVLAYRLFSAGYLRTLFYSYEKHLTKLELAKVAMALAHHAKKASDYETAIKCLSRYFEISDHADDLFHRTKFDIANHDLPVMDELCRLYRSTGRLGKALDILQKSEKAVLDWPNAPDEIPDYTDLTLKAVNTRYPVWTAALHRMEFLGIIGKPDEALQHAATLAGIFDELGENRRLTDMERSIQGELRGFIFDAHDSKCNFNEALLAIEQETQSRPPRFVIGQSTYHLNTIRGIFGRIKADGISTNALAALAESKQHLIKLGIVPDIVRGSVIESSIHLLSNDPQSALASAEHAIKLAQTGTAKIYLPSAILALATAKFHLENFDEAYTSSLEALSLARQLGLKHIEPEIIHLAALIHFAKGEDLQGFDSLELAAQQALLQNNACLYLTIQANHLRRHLHLGNLSEAADRMRTIDAHATQKTSIPRFLRDDIEELHSMLPSLMRVNSAHEDHSTSLNKRPNPTPNVDSPSPAEQPSIQHISLQPSLVRSDAAINFELVGKFHVRNLSDNPSRGSLFVESSYFQPNFIDEVFTVVFGKPAGAPESAQSAPFTLLPAKGVDINLHFPAGLIHTNLAVDIKWVDDFDREVASTWSISFDPAEKYFVRFSQVSLVAITPFSQATFYDTLYSGDFSGVVNFKVVANEKCRIEIFDERTGALIAVDANGDGRFDGIGDILAFDRDSDGFPDMFVEPNRASPLSLRVTPLNFSPGKQIEFELLRHVSDGWISESINVLHIEESP